MDFCHQKDLGFVSGLPLTRRMIFAKLIVLSEIYLLHLKIGIVNEGEKWTE